MMDIKGLELGIEEFILDSDSVKIEDERGRVKTYRHDGDGKFELVEIKDENGEVFKLTAIPDERFTDYKVDLDKGRIYSLKSDRFLKTNPNRMGYHYTTISNVPIAVHVVIAMAKYGINRDVWLAEGKTINHIDYNKCNQSADNLEIIYHHEQFDENVRKRMGTGTRLTDDQLRHIKFVSEVLKIKDKYKTNEVSHVFANAYKKDYVTIFNLLVGNTYKNIGLNKAQQRRLDELRLQVDLQKFGVDLAA